jgi:hypothetical protein
MPVSTAATGFFSLSVTAALVLPLRLVRWRKRQLAKHTSRHPPTQRSSCLAIITSSTDNRRYERHARNCRTARYSHVGGRLYVRSPELLARTLSLLSYQELASKAQWITAGCSSVAGSTSCMPVVRRCTHHQADLQGGLSRTEANLARIKGFKGSSTWRPQSGLLIGIRCAILTSRQLQF